PGSAADGRAVRRARRHHPRGNERVPARHLGAHAQDGGAGHALNRRGRVPVPRGARDGDGTGAHHRDAAGNTAASADRSELRESGLRRRREPAARPADREPQAETTMSEATAAAAGPSPSRLARGVDSLMPAVLLSAAILVAWEAAIRLLNVS